MGVLLLLAVLEPATAQTDPAADYGANCAVCHGPIEAHNDSSSRRQIPLPADFSPPPLGFQLTRSEMIAVVSNGRAGTPMAGWLKRLGADRIAALVDYVRERAADRLVTDGGDSENRGAKLYAQHCESCHGPDGSGTDWARQSLSSPPTDFTNPRLAERLSRERLVFSTVNGRPGTAMPAYSRRLNRAQIEQIADHIGELMTQGTQAKDGQSSNETPASDMPSSEPDSVRGKALYTAYCADCHGVSGEGDGPRSRLSQPPPGNLRERSLKRSTILQTVRGGLSGTSMPAWGHVLGEQELADVSEYVFESISGNP